jgi:hypothetical protein
MKKKAAQTAQDYGKVVGVRIKEALLKQAEGYAAEQHVSVPDVLRMALIAYLRSKAAKPVQP